MTWLGTILSGIWGKIAAAGAIVLGLLILVGKIMRAGRDKERADQAAKAAAMRRTADEVERRVDAAGPAERDKLRSKWTRP